MAKKMDFLEFASDLPDEEGDEVSETQAELSSELQGPIPPGVYYKVSGSKIVLVKNKGCKMKQ